MGISYRADLWDHVLPLITCGLPPTGTEGPHRPVVFQLLSAAGGQQSQPSPADVLHSRHRSVRSSAHRVAGQSFH